MPGGNFGSYQPQFGSISIALTTVASVGVSPSTIAGGPQGLRLCNISTNDAYVWLFPTSTGLAALPTTSAVGLSFPVRQRSETVVSCGPIAYVSGLTTGATLAAVVVLTPGSGLP